MYKILIADDEEIERSALKLILSRNMKDLQIVGDAANGIEAVDLARAHQPHIILMDIKMPGIDGLKAIKEIKTFLPEAKILVVTAFGDFEYAQKALKMGVEDYLLKPVKSQKLIETVENVIKKIECEKTEKAKLVSQTNKIANVTLFIEREILNDIIAGGDNLKTFDKYTDFLELDIYKAFCMVIDLDTENSDFRTKSFESIDHEIELSEVVAEIVKEVTRCLVCELVHGRILILVPVREDFSKLEAYTWSKDLSEYIKSKLSEKLISISGIGIGGKQEGYENIKKSYQECLKALKQCEKKGSIVHFADIQALESTSPSYPFAAEKEMCDKLLKGERENCFLILEEIIDSIYSMYYGNLQGIRSKLYELVIVLYRQVAVSCELNFDTQTFFLEMNCIKDITKLRQWMKTFLENMLGAVENGRQRSVNTILVSAVDYVNSNYTKDLTLEEVAYEVNVSPFYLSKLFKQKLNKNFIDYIADQRINKAKELLKHTNKSMKEISYLVGYNNQTYFCKVFKKVVGISAGEYRERNYSLK